MKLIGVIPPILAPVDIRVFDTILQTAIPDRRDKKFVHINMERIPGWSAE